MRYYREVGGSDFRVPVNIYRDNLSGTVERKPITPGPSSWAAVDRGWFYDRLDGGDPTLDRISEAEAKREAGS